MLFIVSPCLPVRIARIQFLSFPDLEEAVHRGIQSFHMPGTCCSNKKEELFDAGCLTFGKLVHSANTGSRNNDFRVSYSPVNFKPGFRRGGLLALWYYSRCPALFVYVRCALLLYHASLCPEIL